MEKKRAIAVLYSNKTLLDFVWYYCTYGQDYNWDACLIQAGHKITIKEVCEKTGIFQNIICDEENFMDMPFCEKMKTFLAMLGYYLIGKRELYCRRFVAKRFNYDDYSKVVIIKDGSILMGVLTALSKQKETIFLEDGTHDFIERYKHINLKNGNILTNLSSYMLAIMGYADPTGDYWFEKTKYCEKFSSRPDKLKYRNYKNICQLNDMTYTDEKKYKEIIEKAFPVCFDDYTSVEKKILLITNPMTDFSEETEEQIKKTDEYLKRKYPGYKVYVKKHPRDMSEYDFAEEINSIIPAELILNGVAFKKIIYTFPSSTLLSTYKSDYEVLYYEFLEGKTNTNPFHYEIIFKEFCKTCEIDNSKIMKIE